MSKARLFSPARKEAGFTLIELLTVIVIIGILAAIAIPVFTSQRARAQDSQTISDIRNIAVQAETIMSDPTKTYDDVTKANIEFASSKNVSWNISGKASLGGYCIVAKNEAGKKYTTDATALTYDSLAGGVGQTGKACNQTTNPIAPSGSTGVGSDVATPVVMPVGQVTTLNTTGTGRTGTIQTFSVTDTGKYKIEAWGAKGGNITSTGYTGGSGAYATGTLSLTAGQNLSVLVGQPGGNETSGGAGGGGGTFVATSTGSSATALVVAGGGGGATSANYGVVGSNTSSGTGTSGGGGTIASNGQGSTDSNGGAGFLTNGNGWNGGAPSLSYISGGTGAPGYNAGNAFGGFGGGSGGISGCGGACAGGAGGYSGGSAGGGGGTYVISSYNGSTVTGVELNNNTKANAGTGKVVITRIS